MKQELEEEQWQNLTRTKKEKFEAVLGRDIDGISLPSIGDLIEFLHSTGYDWEIGFGKKTFDPTGEVEFERNIFRVRLPEEGLIFRDKELIEAVFSCVKGVLKGEDSKD